MITGTFNGLNVVALPNSHFTQVQLTMNDKVVATPGAFSQAAQTLDWQIDWWTGKLSLPPMVRADAQKWIAFLAECRGMSACFLVGDSEGATPSGHANGVPVTSGVNASRGTILTTRGWKPNQFKQLATGDYFQIVNRLYMSLEDVNSDGSGDATINCWPRLRESPPDGTKIILHQAQGLFRLAANARNYSLANNRTYSIDIDITECL
jgi:hypothetical protein